MAATVSLLYSSSGDVYKRQSIHLRYLQSVFYKGSYNFPHRQIQVVQAQIVIVLYGEMVFMEIAFQNSCRLCSIRERKPDMFTAFLLQLSKE